ncbi:MAG: RNA 2'-phosphotransferase [Selenomonadaceae bacterium]|nr:RNA 2'-phosphotransferase [Selenomonadaceae bacterium]
MDKNEIGKFIALILRHRPDAIGITLDEHGWANVEELIAGISRNYDFNMAMLEDIVKSDNKQRYSFNDDKTLIRANQGHSIAVDIDLQPCKPPDILYHGTAEK